MRGTDLERSGKRGARMVRGVMPIDMVRPGSGLAGADVVPDGDVRSWAGNAVWMVMTASLHGTMGSAG